MIFPKVGCIYGNNFKSGLAIMQSAELKKLHLSVLVSLYED